MDDNNEIVQANKKIVLGGSRTSAVRRFKGGYKNVIAFTAGETKTVKVRGMKATGTVPFSFNVNYEGESKPVTLKGDINFTVYSTKIIVR